MTFGAPELLFEDDYLPGALGALNYDVSSAGERFLMVRSTAGQDREAGQVHLVQHWFEELKHLVPID